MARLRKGGNLNNLQWTCHVCGKLRPDDKISVYTRDDSARHDFPPGTIQTNVRYCNDNPECEKNARYVDFMPSENYEDHERAG